MVGGECKQTVKLMHDPTVRVSGHVSKLVVSLNVLKFLKGTQNMLLLKTRKLSVGSQRIIAIIGNALPLRIVSRIKMVHTIVRQLVNRLPIVNVLSVGSVRGKVTTVATK